MKLEGAKYDTGKLKLSRVPPEVITAIATVRDFGCQKYGNAEDWKSIAPDRWHEALLRHALELWNDPYHIDAESGLPSLWHLATNAAFLCVCLADTEVFQAADVAPVVHGCKFCSKEDKGAMCWDCSDLGISIEYRAGKIRITTEAGDEAYLTVEHCPCCGARMDGGAGND